MNESYEMVKERNEKNKIFRKRLKNFYIARYGLIGILILGVWGFNIFADSKTVATICLGVLGVIFVIWFLWCIINSARICCPHCNKFIGRSDPWNISKCPYCGTSLEILQYLEREKL